MRYVRKELLMSILTIVDRAEHLYKTDTTENTECEISINASSYDSVRVLRECLLNTQNSSLDSELLLRDATYHHRPTSSNLTQQFDMSRLVKCALTVWTEIPGVQNCYRGYHLFFYKKKPVFFELFTKKKRTFREIDVRF